jgi:hypothetical protein
MRRIAVVLAGLALAFGLPQLMLGISAFFEGGWRMPMSAGLIALPLLPLFTTLTSSRWPTPHPAVPIMLAFVSLVVSAGFYWFVYSRFAAA